MALLPYTRQTAAEHAAELIAWFIGLSPDTAGRLTDLNDGSNIKILAEAIGVRHEHLDAKAWLALKRLIPTVLFDFFGEGDGLTSTVGFPALPALPASGIVTVVRDPDVTPAPVPIPTGTRLQVPAVGTLPAQLYTTSVPATLGTLAASVDVPVVATLAGSAGNAAARTLVLMDSLSGVLGTSTTNPAALFNGHPAETDEDRRIRFVRYLRGLARSPLAGLEAGALTARVLTAGVVTEQALFARAVTRPEFRGLVDIYVDNGGGTASPALVADAQMILDGSRTITGERVPGYLAAGVVGTVRPVTPQVVPVTATIQVTPGFDGEAVRALVVDAITTFVADLGVFNDLIVTQLEAAVLQVRGVRDIALTAPAANIVAALGARIVPGTIAVTWT